MNKDTLRGKKIILGVCGSIAAYKAAYLTRLLVKAGAEVRVIMTTSATDFITPLTLATLSKNPVYHQYFEAGSGQWHNHVELGLWADAMVIAPASANTLAKFANGICDNLLSAVYLSARCPVFIAPAMDLDMYKHPSTMQNMERLRSYGNYIIEAGYGELASGLEGQGRLAEPEEIQERLQGFFSGESKMLLGKKILITAGPTYEAIDPVRFVGNHSTGKMGYALAEAAAKRGALVTLISGPSHQSVQHPNIQKIAVTSAQEMYNACAKEYKDQDVAIFAAAVADYKPADPQQQKIKKKGDRLNVELVKNVDIAASLGKQKQKGQLHVGFALETENEEFNALEKLNKKNFDLIVLNSLNDKGAGFGHDTNKVIIFDTEGNKIDFDLKSKQQVAEDIVSEIIKKLHA